NRALHGKRFPTERGARNRSELRCQQAKLVATLAAIHPALAGLQEIENNGYGKRGALAHLAAALNHATDDANYRYIHPSTRRLGDGLVAPAILYDATRLQPTGQVAVLDP